MQAEQAITDGELAEALEALRRGGVVVFPTDTLYGLGADATNEKSVERVLQIKGRPASLGIPLLLATLQQAEEYVAFVPPLAQRLAQAFWPGPLTLVLPRSSLVSDLLTGGRPTIALRVPDHPVPRTLAARLGRPLTGTSANRHGQPDPRTLAQVRQQLEGDVDLVLDGGPLTGGLASTIVEVRGEELLFLRQGVLPEEAVRAAVLGKSERDAVARRER
jgi:L-threonylcarbamoyladenylate synthase